MEYKGLGKKIRHLRERKGWSKSEFADKVDISESKLVQIETGVMRNIPDDMLYRIARALHMDVEDLVRGL